MGIWNFVTKLCPWPAWQIAEPAPVTIGFDTTIGSGDLAEACRRLGVQPYGALQYSATRKAVGSAVIDPEVGRSWVKVSALRGTEENWYRDGELAAQAITGVPKPSLIKVLDWKDGDRYWRALQLTLALSPCRETPWAGLWWPRVSEKWIASLVDSMIALRHVPTDRWRVSPHDLAALIRERFGNDAPHAVDVWQTAHGDLQWSNLTWPRLSLLDWECWGLAPQGFDAAYLVAFSCANRDLMRRLETAFADQLQTPSGRVARLAVYAQLLHTFEVGLLDRRYRAYIEPLASEALEQARRGNHG